MKSRLILLIAGSLLSINAFAGQFSCTERKADHASLSIEVVTDELPVASATVPATPTSPAVTEGKILLAGDAPCNPKVTVCED